MSGAIIFAGTFIGTMLYLGCCKIADAIKETK